MPVKYFASKVTVSLIWPSRDNRGQKMIAPPTALYNHGTGLNNLTLRLSIVKPLNSENHGINITYHSILFRKQFTLCIGYRTFQTKDSPLLDLGEFFFRTSTQVKAETPKASSPLPVNECGKRSFPYFIMLSSFV
jgi:hypothetical protein